MIYKLPKEFLKGFESYSESDYKLITSKIQEIWGFEIIQKVKWYYEPILTRKTDQDFLFDRNGNYDLSKPSKIFKFDGIITYDKNFNRFVIFQFRKDFVYIESSFQIIDGVSYFSYNWDNLGINYSKISYEKLKENDVNIDLTKLIIFYLDTRSSQLMEYFDPKEKYSKVMELWKITPVDNNVISLEKVPNDHKDDDTDYLKISENEFFELSDLGKKTINNYYLFKECLKFNFSGITIYIFNDYEKVNQLIKDSYEIQNFEYEDKSCDKFIEIKDGKIDLQSYLNGFVNYFNQSSENKGKKLSHQYKIDYLTLELMTKDHYRDFILLFILSIKNGNINVIVSCYCSDHYEDKEIITEFEINKDSKYSDFNNIITSIYEYLNNYNKNKHENENKTDEVRHDDDERDNLPF